MKCAICDREDALITYDKVTKKFGDCTVCQAIIDETLEYFDEDEEDEFEG